MSGLHEDQIYDVDRIHEAYKKMPEYEQFKELAEMVFDTVKQFNLKFETYYEPNDLRAGVSKKGDHVMLTKLYTLLHSIGLNSTMMRHSIYKKLYKS